jgi:hypothetical protein
MGLAICRSIVEAHGGRLWATANADRVATFQFTLPGDYDRIVSDADDRCAQWSACAKHPTGRSGKNVPDPLLFCPTNNLCSFFPVGLNECLSVLPVAFDRLRNTL